MKDEADQLDQYLGVEAIDVEHEADQLDQTNTWELKPCCFVLRFYSFYRASAY